MTVALSESGGPALSSLRIGADRARLHTPERRRNVSDATQAITVITPLQPRWGVRVGSWTAGIPPGAWLRVLFWFLGHWPGATGYLRRLGLVHAAHWAIVKRLPVDGTGGQRNVLKHQYLLAETNFVGSWNQYLDGLLMAIGPGMAAIWGSSYGYPGVQHEERFMEYVRRNEQDACYYWSAYPDVTCNEVAAAIELRAKLARFQAGARELDAEPFQRAFEAFLTDVQRLL